MGQYKKQNTALRARVEALSAHLSKQSGGQPFEEIPIPSSYIEMPDWAEKYLAGKLELHPRAARSLNKALYENPPLVYQALLVLANEYRNARTGVSDDRAFKLKCKIHGFDFSGAIDPSRAGQEADVYFVNYPFGTQQRKFLKYHLCKGNSRDRRYCMRIYFFWDEDTRQVIVGALPGHLDNVAT